VPGLSKKQMKIAGMAAPRNKITGADFMALRRMKQANGKGKMTNAAKKKK
tara:strand:- start:183 stop:332 length:150 start_codon:yes stop_codon:yes gene_type:complete